MRSVWMAKTKNAMPDFMSSTPGPHKRPCSSRSGICASVPRGQTVSECASTRILPASGFRAGQLELAAQVIAEAAAGQRLHVGRSIQTVGQKIHEAVDGLRLIARRLASGQLANECDDGRLFRFRKSKKRMHCLL